jgi:hypothetical protein
VLARRLWAASGHVQAQNRPRRTSMDGGAAAAGGRATRSKRRRQPGMTMGCSENPFPAGASSAARAHGCVGGESPCAGPPWAAKGDGRVASRRQPETESCEKFLLSQQAERGGDVDRQNLTTRPYYITD